MTENTFKKIPNELWIILASASGNIDKTQNLLQKPVNWDVLLQMALHHRVYSLVYETFNQLNNHGIHESTIGYLKRKYEVNAIQGLYLTGETVRMVKCLESQGIHAVVLKGPPLALRLYGDVAIRPYQDIDILVPPDELVKAQGILEKEGYCEIDNPYPKHIFTPGQSMIIKRSLSQKFHVNYWHNTKNVNIELHWRYGKSIHELPFPNESSINRIEIAGYPLPVLCDEDWLIYLILHGAGHAWFRLRWLVDIARFAQQEGINWEKTVNMAKSVGIQTLLHQSLILANRLLDIPIPANLKTIVDSDRAAWRLSQLAIKVCIAIAEYEIWGSNGLGVSYWQSIYNFYARREWKKRFYFVLKNLQKLFSPSVYDFMDISLPDRLLGLYYVLHPFCFLYRRYRGSVNRKWEEI